MLALVSALVVAAAAVVVGLFSPTAGAAGAAPTFEPDPQAVGTLTFYDAAGKVKTSGALDQLMANYYAGSAGPTPTSTSPGNKKATAYWAQPADGSNPATWNSVKLTASASYGTAFSGSYPGPLANSPNAIAVGNDATNKYPIDAITDFPSISSKDPNVFEVRVSTGNAAEYYRADVKVDTAANTWTLVYPTAVVTKTATSVSAITANPSSPAPHGATVKLTGSVTATDGSRPAGTVHLFDGTTDKGAAAFNAATGAVSATDAPADGSHSYTFVFTPSATTYSGSTSAALAYTVSAVTATTTALAVTPAGGSTAGQAVTLTATVTPSAAAGSVTFKDGGASIGSPVTVSGGKATLTTANLSIATHGLTAVFTPSNTAAYSASTSPTVSYTVAPKPATTTSTTLAAVSSPVAYGANVSLSATVAPAAAVGTVQFLDGTTVLGAGTAGANGTYTFATSSLAAGPHSLSAKFVPTDATKYGASTSNTVSLTVSAQPTITALTAPSTVDQNASTTLTAKVAPTTAVGSVTFKDGSTTLGSAAVSSGVATLSTSFATVGPHSVTATFVPADSTRFAGSSSAASTVTVNKPAPGATSTALATDRTSVVSGTGVTLTATITPSSATGSVQFLEGSTPLGAPVTVTNGKATFSSKPAVGSHTYQAVFTPDTAANLTGSSSATVTVTVAPPPTSTTTSLTASPTGTVAYGAAVTFTAKVAASTVSSNGVTPAAAVLAGTVAFEDGSTTIGTAAVSNGVATFSTSSLGSGPHSITAVFTPTDPTAFTTSTSPAVTVTVGAQPTTTAVGTSPAGTAAAGAVVTITATLTPAAATGTVTFKDGASTLGTAAVSGGKAALTVSTLAVGSHQLTAVYAPASTPAFAGSTSAAVSLKVVAAPTITGVTARGAKVADRGPVAAGSPVTVSGANFVPGETVSLLLAGAVLTTAVVGTDGTVSATATVPNGTSGTVVLTLRGSLAAPTFTVVVTAAGAGATTTSTGGRTTAGGAGGNLASTGADLLAPLGLGLALLVAGAAVAVAARGRRARHAA